VQYIAVAAGLGGAHLGDYPPGSAAFKYGNAGRIVAFRLGGDAVPVPAEVDWDANIPALPARLSTDKATLERGQSLFYAHCGACHGDYDGPGGYPNLLRLTPEKHQLFDEIVLRGAFEARGMAGFSDVLKEADSHAIHAYLIDTAYQVRQNKE
jgi:quinohemoprotein ethanol dehydrogenase